MTIKCRACYGKKCYSVYEYEGPINVDCFFGHMKVRLACDFNTKKCPRCKGSGKEPPRFWWLVVAKIYNLFKA